MTADAPQAARLKRAHNLFLTTRDSNIKRAIMDTNNGASSNKLHKHREDVNLKSFRGRKGRAFRGSEIVMADSSSIAVNKSAERNK